MGGNAKEDAMKQKSTGNRCAIYARVSTGHQDEEMQLRELRASVKLKGLRIDGTYVDRVSSAKQRPQLNALLADAAQHKFDAIACWKFDRIARSVIELVTVQEKLEALGVKFISQTEGVDTTTKEGKFSFTVLAAAAELERAMIRERVKAGLRSKRADGWWPGPRGAKHITPAMFKKVHELRDRENPLTYREIGERLGLTAMTVWKLAKRQEF
jgi:DNA invertase Pin-like site-specific DNA recombinase